MSEHKSPFIPGKYNYNVKLPTLDLFKIIPNIYMARI